MANTTKKFLDFTGLSLYDTKIKAYIADQIGGAGKLTYSVVESLPEVASADAYTIYLVSRSAGQKNTDVYDEFLLINGAFEMIGNTEVDFSNYYTKTEIDTKVSDLKATGSDTKDTASIAGAKLYAADLVANKNVGASGETGASALVTASASSNSVTVASTQKLQDAVSAAESAIQEIEKSGNYINVTAKSSNKQTVSLTVQGVSSSDSTDSTKMGLAEASDVKDYVDSQIGGKNVSASGETGDNALVTASASNNAVTVGTTSKLQNAVSKAESSIQTVSKGATTNENKVSISVSTDSNKNVTVTLSDADLKTWIDKIDGDNTTNGSIAKAAKDTLDSAKSYADGKITGLTETTKTGNGTYVSATVVTEQGQVKSVSVSDTIQAISTADSTDNTKKGLAEASDVKDYVDSQVGGKNVSASGETGNGALVTASASNNAVTVASTQKLQDAVSAAETAVQDVKVKIGTGTAATIVTSKIATLEVAEGATNGTVKIAGSDVAVHGLDTAAYTTVTALNSTAQGYANAVLGTNADTKTDVTVYGARAYADDLVSGLNPVDSITTSEINSLFPSA